MIDCMYMRIIDSKSIIGSHYYMIRRENHWTIVKEIRFVFFLLHRTVEDIERQVLLKEKQKF